MRSHSGPRLKPVDLEHPATANTQCDKFPPWNPGDLPASKARGLGTPSNREHPL